MKARLNPLFISLKELPPEGREFIYTRESGELNDALKDLIGKNPYQVEFQITPMGNAYGLQGSLNAESDLECSLCAIDFKHKFKEKLNELLVQEKPLLKGDQLGKANHAHEWVDNGPDCIMIESDSFDVAEYIHEVIALAEPIRPLGKPNCDISCENLTEDARKLLSDGSTINIRVSPFKVLEKIKLKS